jgi:serine/threonine protein kinase
MSNPESNPTTCPKCGRPRDLSSGQACPHCLMLAAMEPTEGAESGAMPVPSLAEVSAAFPQLEILDLIGQGGMGCVFKARQPRLNRLVALKLLPASLAQRDPAFAGRFEREGQLLARLHHPNIVAVHDSGTAGEFFFLIMEYVDGVNLRQAMRAQRFTAPQALASDPQITAPGLDA